MSESNPELLGPNFGKGVFGAPLCCLSILALHAHPGHQQTQRCCQQCHADDASNPEKHQPAKTVQPGSTQTLRLGLSHQW